MASVRALLFDFGGTLDQPVHWLDRFLAHYRACGFEIARNDLDPAFDYATRIAYRNAAAMRERRLAETLCFLVGLQVDQLRRHGPASISERLNAIDEGGRAALVERISAEFCGESRAGLKRSREILTALKPRFHLGVISNFYGNLDRVLAESGLLELMNVTMDSGRVGIFKPDPRIFEHALAALEVSAAEAAMVGDSPGKDCAPARRAGMKTIWLCGPGRDPRGAGAGADYRIRTLDELLELECLKL